MALVSSGVHREALEKALVSQLMEAVVRPSDQRFYKADLVAAPPTAPIQPVTSTSAQTPPPETPPQAPGSTASTAKSNDDSCDEEVSSDNGDDNQDDQDGKESSGEF